MLKKKEIKLGLLTNIDMLLIVEKLLEVEYVIQLIDIQQQTKSVFTSIWLPPANFEPLAREKSHSPDTNHSILFYFHPKVTGSLVTWLGP